MKTLLPFRFIAVKLALFAAVAVSCSCSSYNVNTTAFHNLPKQGNGETFSVEKLKKDGGIESQQHLSRISEGFIKYGWQPVSGSAKPDYRIYVDWTISRPFEVQGYQTIYGQTSSGGTTYHSGNVSSGYGYGNTSYSGTSYTAPTYGAVGVVETSDTLYTRGLLIMAYDRTGNQALQSKTFSTGSSGSISEVVPFLTKAVFKSFPGPSGKKREYSFSSQ